MVATLDHRACLNLMFCTILFWVVLRSVTGLWNPYEARLNPLSTIGFCNSQTIIKTGDLVNVTTSKEKQRGLVTPLPPTSSSQY